MNFQPASRNMKAACVGLNWAGTLYFGVEICPSGVSVPSTREFSARRNADHREPFKGSEHD